jgi:uncharacterized Ntn-hydrolase superfamily protein
MKFRALDLGHSIGVLVLRALHARQVEMGAQSVIVDLQGTALCFSGSECCRWQFQRLLERGIGALFWMGLR